MEIAKDKNEDIAILRISLKIAEEDMVLFKEALSEIIKESDPVVISMTGAEAETGVEFPVANTLSEFVTEAERQNKNIAIACLPSVIFYKANLIGLGARTHIFCDENSAANYLRKRGE